MVRKAPSSIMTSTYLVRLAYPVQLECYDFLGPDGFRLEDGSVDAVHARSISFG